MGISSDAVRKRAKRGKMPYETGADGKLYVWVDFGETEADSGADKAGAGPESGDPQPEHDEAGDQAPLVETLREQVAYLQGVIATRDRELASRAEEIRRRDSALEREQELAAMFADRLRQLEAPRDEPQAPESVAEEPDKVDTPDRSAGAQEGAERRSWWRRWFSID